jgi:hypothetical protein
VALEDNLIADGGFLLRWCDGFVYLTKSGGLERVGEAMQIIDRDRGSVDLG